MDILLKCAKCGTPLHQGEIDTNDDEVTDFKRVHSYAATLLVDPCQCCVMEGVKERVKVGAEYVTEWLTNRCYSENDTDPVRRF